jgi:hypothetical protein
MFKTFTVNLQCYMLLHRGGGSLLSVPQIQSKNVPCLKQEILVTTDGFYCIIYKYIVMFDKQVQCTKKLMPITRLEVVTTVLLKIYVFRGVTLCNV